MKHTLWNVSYIQLDVNDCDYVQSFIMQYSINMEHISNSDNARGRGNFCLCNKHKTESPIVFTKLRVCAILNTKLGVCHNKLTKLGVCTTINTHNWVFAP